MSIEKNTTRKTTSEETLTVVKRSGHIVPFARKRIQNALEMAFRDTKNLKDVETLPSDIQRAIAIIENQVISELVLLDAKDVSLTVEGIQDIVEVTLMKHNFHDVARDYIIYRDAHKKSRLSSLDSLIIERDTETGLQAKFNPAKISRSLERAFRAAHNLHTSSPLEKNLVDTINECNADVLDILNVLHNDMQKITVHTIVDAIEHALMKNSHFDVAKSHILYTSKKQHLTQNTSSNNAHQSNDQEFDARTENGETIRIPYSRIMKRIEHAVRDLPVSKDDLYNLTVKSFYNGIKEEEVDLAATMAARVHIEKDPIYSTVASRLLLDSIYKEVINTAATDPSLKKRHSEYFISYIKKATSYGRISPQLLDFDLDLLANTIDLSRDDGFLYLGLQTLYDRYFIHYKDKRIETPQIFWMRVAMGLAIEEENKNERAIEFYNLLSQFLYVSSTPTLFNSGTCHSQLSSCFLSTVSDSLSSIFKTIGDDAQLSKWSGGLGNDWTSVRATGSRIEGTNGKSQGVIPFLKVANDTAVAVNQGGKRKGAMVAYLESWHLDIEDFLELRKNSGDERRRTHDMNTANWIPDLFMKRVKENKKWTLFTPSDTPDLHDLYGKAFEKRYAEYEQIAKNGGIALFKEVDAVDLYRKMLSMLFETGHPWMTFKDASNIRGAQDHCGVIHSSNLCTEIHLNTSPDETAVCNLGSINLVKHITNGALDIGKLKSTISTAVRMLDNVVDINFYPIPEAKNANMLHRPVGLGIMGFQDALYMQNISYASHAAVTFADECMEVISYYAILGSSLLAKEKGTYSTYKGSKWDRGLLPIDTLDLLSTERGSNHTNLNTNTSLDWTEVRNSVKEFGMRNSHVMAIAPTATIANIAGVTASIEPTYKHLFVKSNLSGEFTVVNTHLVSALKELDLWDDEMLDDLKYYDGSISEIERIPNNIKSLFLTAFEIEPDWLIECGARRQKWIDQGQSLNLYLANPSGKKLSSMYINAWEQGLKTTYYLRTLGATQIEKSTTDINKRGIQPRWMKNRSASSSVEVKREPQTPRSELDEGCESCQ